MNLKEKVEVYLEYCEFRKELDKKTLKAYRIDLRQYFEFVACVGAWERKNRRIYHGSA